MRQSRPVNLTRTILTGLALSAIPLVSLATQSFGTDTRLLSLPATLYETKGSYALKTDLHTLDLNQLAGGDDFAMGDVVYVHLQRYKKQTSYPFAISQNRPKKMDKSTVMLRGVVDERNGDTLSLRYFFEALPINKKLETAISNAVNTENTKQADIILTVNKRAVGEVKSITVQGVDYPIN